MKRPAAAFAPRRARASMARTRPILDALARLAAAEEAFLRQDFLAPVVRGAGVAVRIAGLVCRLRVEPADFEGWGVFRPASHALARLARQAKMGERLRYLGLLPAVSLIAGRRDGPQWLAAPASKGDSRFRIDGLVPLRLVAVDDDLDLFDTVVARFDGAQVWFEQADPRADPGAAAYLRQSLNAGLAPGRLERPGLTPEQRRAYAAHVAYLAEAAARAARLRDAEERRTAEGRLRQALRHAGADLREFAERGDVFRVTYHVDGRRHTSVVDKQTLAVQTAGICLSGEDAKFDLHSLVGVLREARDGRVFRRT
jgi:hypothetical protein